MLFESTFWSCLNEFKNQQGSDDSVKSPWHQKVARGGDAMNQHQVAMRYQGRCTGDDFKFSQELNSKIEALRNGDCEQKICSDADLKYILQNYNLTELPKDKPKSIFSGVVVQWDPLKDVYMLMRDKRNERD